MSDDAIEKLKTKIQEDKDFTTNRLSEQSRYISFGVLAVVFSLLSSDSGMWKKFQTDYKTIALCGALLAIASILLDFFQYIFGYFASCKAAGGCNPSYKYQKSWVSYRLRMACFWAKQGAAGLSGILLLAIIYLTLI